MYSRKEFALFCKGRASEDALNAAYGVPHALTPNIIEERQTHAIPVSVFDRLMQERIIFLGRPITDYVANVINAQLLYLDSVSKDPISIYINSPGGDVYSGLGIYDVMMFIESKVYTQCTGMAASMAAVLLAGGEKGHRSALPHSRVMIHQPLGDTGYAQATDIEIISREMQEIKLELCQVLAERTGRDVQAIMQDCERDRWMKAEAAVEYGIIDNIVCRK